MSWMSNLISCLKRPIVEIQKQKYVCNKEERVIVTWWCWSVLAGHSGQNLMIAVCKCQPNPQKPQKLAAKISNWLKRRLSKEGKTRRAVQTSGINYLHHSFMGGVCSLPLSSHGMRLLNDSHIVAHTLNAHV